MTTSGVLAGVLLPHGDNLPAAGRAPRGGEEGGEGGEGGRVKKGTAQVVWAEKEKHGFLSGIIR